MTAKRAVRVPIHSGIARHDERSRVVRATISGSDHSFCTVAFCAPRVGGRDLAVACSALPRRHCSTAGTALGSQLECVDDQLLGGFLSLVHTAAFLSGRISLWICAELVCVLEAFSVCSV